MNFFINILDNLNKNKLLCDSFLMDKKLKKCQEFVK